MLKIKFSIIYWWGWLLTIGYNGIICIGGRKGWRRDSQTWKRTSTKECAYRSQTCSTNTYKGRLWLQFIIIIKWQVALLALSRWSSLLCFQVWEVRFYWTLELLSKFWPVYSPDSQLLSVTFIKNRVISYVLDDLFGELNLFIKCKAY